MEHIETERLILRNFEKRDYSDLYEFLAQRKEDRFEAYPDITYENGIEHMEYRLENDCFVAMELKESGKVIGNIFLGVIDDTTNELGYIVNKNYQHKGYGYEATKCMMGELKKRGIEKLVANTHPENTCSRMLLEKLGFVQTDYLKNHIFFLKDVNGNPIWEDTVVYSLYFNKK